MQTISDVTKLGEYAYNCQITDGNVKAIATVRETSIRRGAYEMSTRVYNTTGAALGARQRGLAECLRSKAIEELVIELQNAGWTSEWVSWRGMNVTLWLQPQ